MMRNRRNKAEDDNFRRQIIEEYRELREEYGNDPAVDLDLNYNRSISNTIFMVRGKQITHEQSVQVLAATEPLFQKWDKDHLIARRDPQVYDPRVDSGVLSECLFKWYSRGLSSWLLSDGTVGGNIKLYSYDELWRILPEWVELAKACPFLDMAVGYTTVSSGETICSRCRYSMVDDRTGDYYDRNNGFTLRPGPNDEYRVEQRCAEECERRKELFKAYVGEIKPAEYEFCYAERFDRRMHHKDMHKFVRGCFIIKNGHISMYWGDAGRDRFKEYYDRYHDPYLDGLYGQQIPDTGRWHIWSRSDVIDAFALKGLPAKCYDIAVYCHVIREIPADAPILTAEWLRRSHREMCGKWNIPIE